MQTIDRSELIALLPRLRRGARALTMDRDAADDLVQAACERALRHGGISQPGVRLDSWMYRIMLNLWIDQRRSQRVRGEHLASVDPDSLEGGNAEREAETALTMVAVHRAVASLSEEHRAILTLIGIEGMAYKEAAEVLDLPIGTVMSRLARARQTLARLLDPEWEGKEELRKTPWRGLMTFY
ncbi:MAG: RNA polymerase sigma factor [Alphaproteobacteria bacterium]